MHPRVLADPVRGGSTLWAFHSAGSTADEAAFAGRLIADPSEWNVVAVESSVRNGKGGFDWVQGPAAKGRDTIDTALEAATEATRPGQVVRSLGISQGCIPAVAALDRGSAAAMLWLPVPIDPELVPLDLSGKRIRCMLGASDEVVLPVEARAIANALRGRGAFVQVEEYATGHSVSLKMIVSSSEWIRER